MSVEDLSGRSLSGAYRLTNRLQSGATASIYRATREGADDVAIKVLHPHLNQNGQLKARFLREAKVFSKLQHPNIVHVAECRDEDDLLYIVMELVRGEDLVVPILRDGGVSERVACEIMIQVCNALGHAHDRGIVHRDIKPENIVLLDGDKGDAPRVKVLDFGIAKLLDAAKLNALTGSDESSTTSLTRVGSLVGTPAYMSPEQGRGEPIDHRHDIYACGVVLYELLTGARPFDGANPLDTLMLHVTEAVPAPSDFMTIDDALERTLLKALEKQPKDRFSSASELAEALRTHLSRFVAATHEAPGVTSSPANAAPEREPTEELTITQSLAVRAPAVPQNEAVTEETRGTDEDGTTLLRYADSRSDAMRLPSATPASQKALRAGVIDAEERQRNRVRLMTAVLGAMLFALIVAIIAVLFRG